MRHRYIAGFVSLIVSPGGVGKSAFTMLDAVSMATGRPLTGFEVPTPAPVWLYNTEDPSDELDRRMIALSMAHGISLTALENIRITSGRDAPLTLASGNREGVIVNTSAIDHVIKHINELGIRVLITDPFVRTHRVQENDNAQIDAVLWCFQQIIDKTNCAVGIVHHTRKPTEASGGGSMHDARGASALVNAARIAHTLSTMTKEEADAFGIVEERRRYYIRLDNVKANLHPPAERADWYEKVSVTLPNDDDVGTLRHTPLATLAAERKRQKREQQIVDLGIMLDAIMDIGTERSIAEIYRDLRDTTEFERIFRVVETTARKLIIELLHDTPKHNGKLFTYRRKAHGQTQNMVACMMALDILEI